MLKNFLIFHFHLLKSKNIIKRAALIICVSLEGIKQKQIFGCFFWSFLYLSSNNCQDFVNQKWLIMFAGFSGLYTKFEIRPTNVSFSIFTDIIIFNIYFVLLHSTYNQEEGDFLMSEQLRT